MEDSAPNEVESALALIAEMSLEFAATRDIDAALLPALGKIVAYLDAEVGSIWLVEGDEVVCHASVGPDPITGLRLAAGEGIIGRAVRDCCCQRILDVRSDSSFSTKADGTSGFVTRSLLCAPLGFADQVFGAIEVVNKRGGDGCFREQDVHPLQVMASSAALAIANARMAKDQVEHERVRIDLELAGELQRSLLPSQPEASFPIHACNLPARTVSGDFYDYLEIGEGRIAFCLGDVSGKGINAALLMAKASSLYRLLARTSDCTASLLRVLNDELHARSVRGMFVTMLAGVYEPTTGRVRIANAGHEPALLRDPEGRISEIGADAPPLGILPSAEGLASLTEQTVELGGGSLYVFSDGLTEALDEHGEQLGAVGLKRLIERFAERPLHGRVEALMSAVNGLDARDDLTLLCLDPSEHGVVRAESELTIRFRAQAAELAGARSRVRELLDGADVEESVGADIVLAIDEACQNVIRHCYGEAGGDIVLHVRHLGDAVEVELTDFGPCVDQSALEGRDLDDVRPGGLGIHLIRGCMDDVAYRDPPAGGGNVLRMVKRLHTVKRLR